MPPHRPDPDGTTPDPRPSPDAGAGPRGVARGGLLRWGYAAFLLASLALHAFAWTLFAAEWRTLHRYAETTCTVLDKRVEELPGGDAFRPGVKIRYTAAGREREAWTYDATRAASDDRRDSRSALGEFAVGGRRPCWYDPADPDAVVVVRGHAGFTWALLGVTAAMALLAISCLAYGGRADPTRLAGLSDRGRRQLVTAPPPGLDTTPFDPARHAGPATHRLSRRGPHALAIGPTAPMYVIPLLLLAAGVGLLAHAWLGAVWRIGGLVAAGLLLSALGSGWLLTLERHGFDRRAGVYRRSALLRRARASPLASIRAVQLLIDVVREEKGDDGEAVRSRVHQINLVLADPECPRRHVLDLADREAAACLCLELAAFLGVPLYAEP